ncbi:MAG: hypothetical protein HKN39_04015 [Flavobacteriales bacterium]|nr:hypothetical protein [Flavobacteriales bacterium]
MSGLDPKHIGRFFLLIFLQGFFLVNAALFDGLAIPFLYVFIILKLPVDINRVLLLVICFISGLSVDLFYHTLGLHAAACVLMGFIRPGILNALQPRDGYDAGASIGISSMGFGWFFIYSVALIFAHHFYLFFLEIFSFSYIPRTLLKVFLSTAYTFILILLVHLIFSKRR